MNLWMRFITFCLFGNKHVCRFYPCKTCWFSWTHSSPTSIFRYNSKCGRKSTWRRKEAYLILLNLGASICCSKLTGSLIVNARPSGCQAMIEEKHSSWEERLEIGHQGKNYLENHKQLGYEASVLELGGLRPSASLEFGSAFVSVHFFSVSNLNLSLILLIMI